MNEKKVLVCVDGSLQSNYACDYGINIAKTLKLPLVFLNVIEHSHLPKQFNLAGNIGIGSQEKLLNELSVNEATQSKTSIALGKKMLQEFSSLAKEQGIQTVQTLQRHGKLEETLEELSSNIQIAIIPLENSTPHHTSLAIDNHIETIIRTLTIPILLVKSPFTPIHSILMAYDGSDFANKAIQTAIKNPIFPNTKRHIVTVNKEEKIGFQLLTQAVNIFKTSSIEVFPACLQGDTKEALLSYQKEHTIDLIAMGAYSHNRFRSVLLGSLTSKMILNTTTPLLLFR